MLHIHNSVVNFYRNRLTPHLIFTSLSPNAPGWTGFAAPKAWRSMAVSAALVAGLAACSTMDTRPKEEVVKARAEARIKAVLAGDTRQMYDFFTPTVRKTLRYEDYASSVNRGFWKAAEVEKVECPKPDLCDVSLSVTYVYKGAKVTTPLKETWIQEGRDWWYAVKG